MGSGFPGTDCAGRLLLTKSFLDADLLFLDRREGREAQKQDDQG